MSRSVLCISFHDYWHVGTGRGGGPGADAVVRRTAEGLPYVPGRTLKGVIRAACDHAAQVGWIEPSQVVQWFGTAIDSGKPKDGDDVARHLEAQRFLTEPGQVVIGSARLGRTDAERQAWVALAASDSGADVVPGLFAELHQTAIEDGVAKGQSLRTIEVAVPMTLWAPLDGADADTLAGLARCLPLVAAIGHGKRRGLGRVELRIVGEGGQL